MTVFYIGYLCIGAGFTVLLPLFTLIAFPAESECAVWYVVPGTVAILAGYLIIAAARSRTFSGALPAKRMEHHQDSAIVLAGWITAVSVNAVPFIISGSYTVSQAIFESTSGWTTTGLSVVDVSAVPHIVLMHRSIMLFFGGMGIILSVLFFLNGSGRLKLYEAEGHADMLAPDVGKSARYIVCIYAGYIAGGAVLYRICGMNWFDALNHSIAALSTGGFSTHSQSIGFYQSPAIEAVTVILMLLGSTNFLVHLYMLTGKWKNIFLYCETKAVAVILAFSIPAASFLIYRTLEPYTGNIPESIRMAVFQTVSALTTTGFQTVPSFAGWPPALMLLLTVLMFIGGGTGSTAGGIKQFRVYTAAKNVIWTIRESFGSPSVIRPHLIRQQDHTENTDEKKRRQILSLVLVYMLCFWTGTAILTLYGYPLGDCMFEIASALGTVGLSCGVITAQSPAPVLWTGSAAMFLGRTEIYLVIFGIMRTVKDCGRCVSRRRKEQLHEHAGLF